MIDRDEIIKLAREAGVWFPGGPDWERYAQSMERFAALVAAAEREKCAKVCESIDTSEFGNERPAPNDCAAAIRARSKE